MGPFVLTRQTKLQFVLIAALALAAGIPDALAQPPSAAPQLPRSRFNLPAPGETRFVPNEVILDSFPTVSTPTLEAIAQRHSMTRLETQTFRLTGRRMHRWRLDGGGSVEAMIRGLVSEQLIAGAQPNYLYSLAESAADRLNSDQFIMDDESFLQAPYSTLKDDNYNGARPDPPRRDPARKEIPQASWSSALAKPARTDDSHVRSAPTL